MHTLILLAFLLAAIKWGDWKNWKDYYPTFLFFMIGDLTYQYLLYNHSMWMFHPSFDQAYLPNHTIISMVKMVIRYSTTIVLFLGLFPTRKSKQFQWLLLWILIYFLVEIVAVKFGLITHHNGWTLGWSLYFNTVMFSILRIHYKTPVLAWILSIINLLFLWHVFDLSITMLK